MPGKELHHSNISIMGEYAKNANGENVKIGTAESLWGIRYDDRHKVKQLKNSLDPAKVTNCYWRLPLPKEDDIEVGEYEYPNFPGVPLRGFEVDNDLDPGKIQLRDDNSGLQASVNCYHGTDLPESTEEVKFNWNGKIPYDWELCCVKNTDKGKLYPVVRCAHCGDCFGTRWSDVIPFIEDEELERRLALYAVE